MSWGFEAGYPLPPGLSFKKPFWQGGWARGQQRMDRVQEAEAKMDGE